METGTKVGFIAILEGELSGMVFDSRWMLALILLCVMADFRFGWADSSKRYNEAKAAGNAVLMDKYKWHTSRAWRRTMNKLMDYIVWVIMGQIVGMAALRPFGIDYTYGGVAATMIIVFMCELPSAFGHFFHLHGVQVERRSLAGFLRAFAVALARRKNPDIGDAMEEGFKGMEETAGRENGSLKTDRR